MFGQTSSLFGTPSTPAFGTPSSTPAFGAPSSTPAFGTPSATPAFGAPSSTPAFGAASSTPAFGALSSTPPFGTPSSTPAFGTPSTPSFAAGFGTSLFSTPFSSQQQQQQQTPSLFQQPASTGFGFQTSFATPQPAPIQNAQLTTQMANVAPVPFSLADRDIQAIVDAYKEEPGNSKYAFKHLLFSVTDPQFRAKPAGVSDIMWAEAMGKLEGMESADRERLWPQLVQGFKDLSQRLKGFASTTLSILFSNHVFHNLGVRIDNQNLNLILSTNVYMIHTGIEMPEWKWSGALNTIQDEVIVSDAERLRVTQSNVKLLQRHFQADTLPWIQRMQQKEQILQRRLLRVMRIVEALEGKGCRIPLTKGEVELAEKLATITRQLRGSGAELSRRVQNLLTVSRVQANNGGYGGSVYLPGSTKIQEQSLADLQEVLQKQTEAIARLGNVLKRDIRDMEIMMVEDTGTRENGNSI
ncbi:nuclear pore complex protein NUP54 [Senna tora]|uniref:Nuclear pore complex protein NUP54 n=1 Tax=Senna tora TaxID=362788 RepID=A0A834T252_9FABA|nr:nuclear pore complex protein NUP54 [Senna tora]